VARFAMIAMVERLQPVAHRTRFRRYHPRDRAPAYDGRKPRPVPLPAARPERGTMIAN
jgi:hypothetical protein